MHTEGQHLILDIWYNDFSETKMQCSLDELVFNTFHVVNTAANYFEPQGITKVYILEESHVTIHTYPEHGYVSLDIYICNPSYNLKEIAKKILGFFPVKRFRQDLLIRGQKSRSNRNNLKPKVSCESNCLERQD